MNLYLPEKSPRCFQDQNSRYWAKKVQILTDINKWKMKQMTKESYGYGGEHFWTIDIQGSL